MTVIVQAKTLFRTGQHQGQDALGVAAKANDPEDLTYLASMCLAGAS